MSLVKQLAALALALAMALVLGLCGLARAQNVTPLCEADLTKLIELQVGDDAVIARVERSGVSFPIDAATLERLRKSGASESILAVVRKAGQPPNTITYEGMLKLVQQGTNEDEILTRLRESPTTFTLDRGQIGELVRAGASPRLIEALKQLRKPVTSGSDISDFVVILDCSGSMKELTPEGISKMDAAKQVVMRFLSDIPEGKRLALIVYGISPIRDKGINCQDVQVVQPLGPLDFAAKERLSQYISTLQPFGWTPLALSLKTAGRELSGSQGLSQLVVVTDGMETCDGNPGQVAEELTRKLSLPHGVDVIGFGVAPQEKAALQDIVARGRGHFYDVQTASELSKALKQWIDHAAPGAQFEKLPIPGQADWDLAPLQKHFAILEPRYDAENNRVVWLAEARRGFQNLDSEFKPDVRFYDAADARVYQATLEYDPVLNVLKGERIRISLGLPDQATLERTKRVLMLTTEKEFPPRPTPTREQDGLRGLPGQAHWDLAPLRKHFAILETRYDAENNRVVWLAEARRGFHNLDIEFKPDVRFYDAADARVYQTTLEYDPAFYVLKGERIRISLGLPDEDTLAKTKRVLFEK